MARVLAAVVAVATMLLGGCSSEGPDSALPTEPQASGTRTAPASPASPTPTPTLTPGPTLTPQPSGADRPDPRWVFYTSDQRLWTSPWFAGSHRVMIPFGCTPAPYYDPDPTCPGRQGKHHGIDVAMPCGTPLTAGRAARVLDNTTLGTAYGVNPVLLRIGEYDVVVGHTTRVFVKPGDRIAAGTRFALAGDSGAPDGCHLHFEVRPEGGSFRTAVDPGPLLGLHRGGG